MKPTEKVLIRCGRIWRKEGCSITNQELRGLIDFMNTSAREQATILVSTWARDTSTFATLVDAITAALEAKEREVSKLEGYLERANWRRCDIAACNCNGYHNWNPSREEIEREAIESVAEERDTLKAEVERLRAHADLTQTILMGERDEARRLLEQARSYLRKVREGRLYHEDSMGMVAYLPERIDAFLANPAARALGEVGSEQTSRKAPMSDQPELITAYRLKSSCISGRSDWHHKVFTDRRTAELNAEDMSEEWTDWKIHEVKVQVINPNEGIVERSLVDIDRTSATEKLKERALSKLTPEERKAIE